MKVLLAEVSFQWKNTMAERGIVLYVSRR